MIVVTAGHVDHGKTTLLRALTGKDTDLLAEEKRRGMSIDLGFTYHHFRNLSSDTNDLPQKTLSFVDVPGHTDFADNMLAGAWSADTALLVVSAVEGVMPQTREHLLILSLLCVRNIVVVITFSDRVTPAECTLRQAEMMVLLESFQRQESSFFCVSAVTGQGIDAVLNHLQNLASEPVPLQEDRDGYFRFAIDRAFTLTGFGTIVTGTVRAGTIQSGDSLLHSASGKLVRAKSLRLHDHAVDSAAGGQRLAIAINLAPWECQRGQWLIDPSIHHPIFQLDAKIQFAESTKNLVLSGRRVRTDTPVHMYLGTAHHIVTLRSLTASNLTLDTEPEWYQIRSKEPMFAHCGDRFILRDASAQHTFAGGRVLDIHSPRRKPHAPERLVVLQALEEANDEANEQPSEEALKRLLVISTTGVALDQFALNRNLRPVQVHLLTAALITSSVEYESLYDRGATQKKLGLPTLLASKHFDHYAKLIREVLADAHSKSPETLGLSERKISDSIQFTGPHPLLNALIRVLIERKAVTRTGAMLHLPEHRTTIEPAHSAFIEQLRPILSAAGFVAPRVHELMDTLQMEQQPLERLLLSHCNAGNLVQVSRNRFYLPQTVSALACLFEKSVHVHLDTGISVSQFRDSSGIGRNLCVEILEYFDTVGLTNRRDNVRFLRMPYQNVFTS